MLSGREDAIDIFYAGVTVKGHSHYIWCACPCVVWMTSLLLSLMSSCISGSV